MRQKTAPLALGRMMPAGAQTRHSPFHELLLLTVAMVCTEHLLELYESYVHGKNWLVQHVGMAEEAEARHCLTMVDID